MDIFKIAKEYLILLAPVFLLGLFLLYKIYKNYSAFGKHGLSQMRNYKYYKKTNLFKILILLTSFVLLSISVLRPAWGIKQKTVESKGTDVVFTLDVSKSMLALDESGSIDRLTMAKEMISSFVSAHEENRYGLVIFAGEAFVSTPLTFDTSAFLTFLSGVDSHDVGKQGTNIEAALQASIDRFFSEQDKKRGRSVVIISDGGEEMDGDVSRFAEVARKLNIKIFTIGIGDKKGVPIPENRDVFGRVTYKKHQGETVLTKLNEEPLKKIASATNGEYFHAKNKNDLLKISKKLKEIQTSVVKTEEKIGEEDRYQYFLFPAFLFFLAFIFFDVFIFLFNRKSNIKKYLKFSFMFFLVFALSGCSQGGILFKYYNSRGNENYYKEYYDEANSNYNKAGENSHALKYVSDNNSSLINYRKKEFEDSSKKLEEALSLYCEKEEKPGCDLLYYNLGDTYYRLGEQNKDKQQDYWQKAIESYKKDLKINSEDKDAEENINFILNKIKDNKKNQDQQNEKNKEEKSGDKSSDKENKEKGGGSQSSGQGKSQNNKDASNSLGENDNQKNTNEEASNNSGKDGDQKSASEDKQQNSMQNDTSNSGKDKGDSKTEAGGSSQDNKSDNTSLSENDNKKLEEYMNSLDKQEKKNQEYFQPNPNGSYDKNQNPFDDFFNNSLFDDQFFNNFFGNKPSGGGFGDNNDSNEIDW